MPWAELHRPPPLGVGILKALLAAQGFPSRVLHLNIPWLEVVEARVRARFGAARLIEGLRHYNCLGTTYPGEWIFAQQLPGADRAAAAALLESYPLDEDLAVAWDHLPGFLELGHEVPAFLDACVQRVDWGRCALVGFTSSFAQQASSLCLARRLKQQFPHLRVAFGGANCFDPMGRALLQTYDWLDYVAVGEAEGGIAALVEAVLAGRDPGAVPGFAVRGAEGVVRVTPAQPVRALDQLPLPDHDDYFEQLRASPIAPLINRELAIETSRGCWWGQLHHCTFCGLNWDQRAYRRKSLDRVLAEIETLTARHEVGRVLFSDSIMPLDCYDTLLPALARRTPRLELFWEIKANVTRERVAALRAAGVFAVQPGIESLSTHVLRLMNKGVTALQNVACLKYCAEEGVRAWWNLLYGFPGERPEDYPRILELLASITHLGRPTVQRMRLARFSAYHLRPEEHGIANIRPYFYYPLMYPGSAARQSDLCRYFDYDFPFPVDPERAIEPIRELVRRWRDEPVPGDLRLRGLPDGTSAIDDTRFNRVVGWVPLDETEAVVYRFCGQVRSLAAIERHLAQERSGAVSAAALRRLLTRWVDQRVMVGENERYLALALATSPPGARVVLSA